MQRGGSQILQLVQTAAEAAKAGTAAQQGGSDPAGTTSTATLLPVPSTLPGPPRAKITSIMHTNATLRRFLYKDTSLALMIICHSPCQLQNCMY